MNARFMKDIEKRAMDLAETMRKEIEVHFDSAPGQRSLTDAEHAVWFEEMVARDPLWPLALSFVDGGRRELTRYLRTTRGAAPEEPEAEPVVADEEEVVTYG